jgi:glycosyltransferase involved in cell wall biosynthesis
MTLVEAFSRGTPVIAARIGGLPEIVECNGAGVMFPPGDCEALHAAARSLLENETVWRTYSDAAWRAYTQKYSRRPAMEALDAIYKQVLE